MMKRIVTIILSLVLVLATVPAVYAQSVNSSFTSDDLEALFREYMEYPEFAMHYKVDPDAAMDNLERILFHHGAKKEQSLRTETYYDNWVSTSLVQQPDVITGGPASGLMALIGAGVSGNVSGSTNSDKVYTLAGDMQTYTNGDTWVWWLMTGLNYYIGSYQYTYVNMTYESLSDFQSYVQDSLIYGRIPILHAVTSYLGYYGGNTDYHYIAIQRFNGPNSTMTLYDPHYSSSYYGSHVVPVSQAYNSIHAVSGRYLICY